ncbi:glycoside hydrolase family 3 C-terminal domain-containing protein [Paenibacillus sp. P96]|uniref:Glycoside hydrolase family 3 C-terminal domain-containing protein n=1 Tax=Paenibacillus zeirhizosphaerae TaxID=2987519 RepID=A0ABT9FU47_9BACL|nr:glycoside hydrolase family 3 N-terminal domain-containing protein [Paenibacillus sp. P96]MDP4098236.1 glycoside hydrolase family 3 C-terminal domain-containing protein [Paenibacillus sp. P96]
MEKYKDHSLSAEERTADLLLRMTLQEKVGQLNQRMYGWDAYRRTETGTELTDEFKWEVAFGGGMGALYGLFRSDPWSGVNYANGIPTMDNAQVANEVQRYVIEHSRLGIPVLLSEECPHGHQALDGTLFPVNIGAGSTWNPALLERAYAQVAAEIRARGAHIGLVSALDILHEPRWGRSEECYGEDPYLAARMTKAVVQGMQGEDAKDLKAPDKVAAVLKHLCAQGAAQGGMNSGPAVIGERELREIHLPGMLAGVRAGAAGCMAAYNEIDGMPCHANSKLLTGILRDEWGFDGIVMADGAAVDRLLALTESYEAAAALALSSGVDLSLWDKAFTTLQQAVEQGLIQEHYIDRAVARVLLLKFRLGLFDQPYADTTRAASVVKSEAARTVNLQLARESVVLLRNDGRLLPLGASARRIAVIGPNADSLYHQLGDYTSVQRKGTGTTVLQGIRLAAPADTEIVYARGCGIRDESTEWLEEAVEAARSADVAVLVVGGSSARQFGGEFDNNGEAIISEGAVSEMDCGEGVDVADLKLGGIQERLVREIQSTGTPVVVVVIQGRPHELTAIDEHCGALLCAWYPGTEGGQAIGEILFGKVNPSGKLPVSLPRAVGQLPIYYNQKKTSRIRHYADVSSLPLYPFGYGLSYTTFRYTSLRVQSAFMAVAELQQGQAFEISVEVENTGETAGAETAQLYIQASGSGITRRRLELKAFEKVWLAPGESKTITFLLDQEKLSIWNRDMEFALEPCRLKVMVGTSSATAAERELELTVTG